MDSKIKSRHQPNHNKYYANMNVADALKVDDVISKLKKLNCPLLENGEDWWISELLFVPGPHREKLFEWILTKLKFNLQTEPEAASSPTEKLKYLLSVFSSLGLCQKNDHDLIKGTCATPLQLNFWKVLVSILYEKHRIECQSYSDDYKEEACASDESIGETSIIEEYEKCTSYINALCENVIIKHLFDDKVNLFPPDIMKECENTLIDTVSVRQDKERIIKEAMQMYSKDLTNKNVSISSDKEFHTKCYTEFMSGMEEEGLEKEIGMGLIKLQKLASGFDHVYKDMKPAINISPQKVSSVGGAFKNVSPLMESFHEQQSSLSKIKSSYDTLHQLHDQAITTEYPKLNFSNSILSNYISILKNPTEKIDQQ